MSHSSSSLLLPSEVEGDLVVFSVLVVAVSDTIIFPFTLPKGALLNDFCRASGTATAVFGKLGA